MENKEAMEELSKTKQKKNAEALQEIGVRLVDLPEKELKTLDIPDILKDAVLEAQSMTRHGARRRQLQYIGSLMRDLDPEPIQAAVEHISLNRAQAAHKFQQMEAWRDHLISPDTADDTRTLDVFMDTFPHTDRQRLGQLIRNAVNAKDAKKKTRAARGLFQYIREIMETPTGEPTL
ncbi:ribosome biogenesis factor YjgA [Desulfocicer niacini]